MPKWYAILFAFIKQSFLVLLIKQVFQVNCMTRYRSASRWMSQMLASMQLKLCSCCSGCGKKRQAPVYADPVATFMYFVDANNVLLRMCAQHDHIDVDT